MAQLTRDEWNCMLEDDYADAEIKHEEASGCTKMKNVNTESHRWKRGLVAAEALNVINGERQDAYGNPEDSFEVIGNLMDVVNGMSETHLYSPALLAVFNLICLKFGRCLGNPKDKDSWRDFIGYCALGCDIAGAEELEKD